MTRLFDFRFRNFFLYIPRRIYAHGFFLCRMPANLKKYFDKYYDFLVQNFQHVVIFLIRFIYSIDFFLQITSRTCFLRTPLEKRLKIYYEFCCLDFFLFFRLFVHFNKVGNVFFFRYCANISLLRVHFVVYFPSLYKKIRVRDHVFHSKNVHQLPTGSVLKKGWL